MTSTTRRWLEEGRRRHRKGDTRGALEAYGRCLRGAPDQPDVLLLAAMAASQSDCPRDAETFARRAVAVRPDGRSMLTLGKVLLHGGDPDAAVEPLQKAASDSRIGADAFFHLGQSFIRLGRMADAGSALESAISAMPGHAPAWSALGVVRLAAGQAEKAAEALRRSLAYRPGDAGTLANLATALLRLGDHPAARTALEEALAIDPDHRGALSVLAGLEKSAGRLAVAQDAWRRCLTKDPGSPEAWTGLAGVLQASGELEAAGQAYRRALELRPDDPDALAGQAEVFEWQGRYQEGLAELDRARSERTRGLALVEARLLRRLDRPAEARELLETGMPGPGEDAPLRRQFAFSLGAVCDALGDAETAWRWFCEGNRLVPASFDIAAERERQRGLDDAASGDSGPPVPAGTGGRVIFIVGLPRSGTTLVEQILAAHGEVHAAGELPALGLLAEALARASGSAGQIGLAALGRQYLDRLPEHPPGLVVTDKMPLNFRYLGLIASALPGARVIHCCRDVRDVALSCFFTDFIDPTLGFSTRLEWLADFVNLHDQVVDRWRPVLGERFLPVRYEELVADPEQQIRALLKSLGLEWDPACLRPHEQDRIAATASHAQVRRPIYASSVGRWRSYARQLEPFLHGLSGSSADG